MQDWTKLAEFFEQAGVELTLAGQALDGAGLSVTHFVQHVLASFAEYERELIGERLRDARAARRALGLRASGRVPYGYEVNPRTRQLVPHAEESKIVRQIFERAAAGKQATEIARWLNEAGHPTKGTARKAGGLWSGRTVLQLLRNPIYLGWRRVNGELIAAAHEALVDAQTADRVELAIGSRRTTRSRARQRLLPYSDDPYMLRGVLYCGGCGRPMTTSSSKAVSIKRPNAHPRYYRCRGTAAQPACKPPVQVAAAKIEQEVLVLLRDKNLIAGQTESVAAFLDALHLQWKSMGRPQTTEVIRRLIWRATWKPNQGRVELELDEIAIGSLLDGSPSFATSTTRSRPP